MSFKNLNIGTQLKFGFAALLFFVILLGVVSYFQTDQIHQQIEIMYDHPLRVRRAIGKLSSDIFAIHRDMKDIFLYSNEKEIEQNLNQIEIRKTSAFEQINILYGQYLGPQTDIDSLKFSFVLWNSVHTETIRLLHAGKLQEAALRTKTFGIDGQNVEHIQNLLEKIDIFAKSKGDELYQNSKELNNILNRQLFFWVCIILILSLIINYYLLRNIRTPLYELTNVTKSFHNGDLSIRSTYNSKNEFGKLSDSFNILAENIQINLDIKEKVADIAKLMLSEDDARKFFQKTLDALSKHTGSQIAAVYLFNEEQNLYEHFESIGLKINVTPSFAGDSFEGEFGSVLYSRKVQHIKNISQDTHFIFQTVSGQIIPREILTIPIQAGNKVIAIISLASINNYGKQAIPWIENILSTLSARVEGILAYRKIKMFSEKLEQQNSELEAQKAELYSQSAELIEQNTELEVQKKQLDEASRLKTIFLSNMSHELRTPLNSVIALSGVLSRHLINRIPEEEFSYLEVIERNGKHLLSLINDILDISRIEAGYEEIEISNFNVNTLISEVLSMVSPQVQQKNIELLHTNKNSEILINSDSDKCRHILQNLIGNAVKFTEKGKVEVNAIQTGNYTEITVTDTGIGISQEHLFHIFDEFRQADGSTSRKFGGTGLGLAIARKFTILLGGTINVKSKPGEGSEFILTLPLVFPNIINNRNTENLNSSFIPKSLSDINPIISKISKTILLVEDSEPIVIQLKDILEESGYSILVAKDGMEALSILSNSVPDAIILDLMMPGIDGFQVLQAIRESDNIINIPVLILTAKHITKEELKFLKKNDVHQLIQKGDIKRKELLESVAGMVFRQSEKKIKQNVESRISDCKPVILVVEDNSDNMITAKAILSDNYIVLEAVNGKEGVEMAIKHKPNLILMDIGLPEINGIEAFKTIRKNTLLQQIPVIALTASAMLTDRAAILAHGFDGFIAKPIDEKLFIKTINEVLCGK